jgi:hypothetical protein
MVAALRFDTTANHKKPAMVKLLKGSPSFLKGPELESTDQSGPRSTNRTSVRHSTRSWRKPICIDVVRTKCGTGRLAPQRGRARHVRNRQLGHKDSAITLRVYACWLPDETRRRGVDRAGWDAPIRNPQRIAVGEDPAFSANVQRLGSQLGVKMDVQPTPRFTPASRLPCDPP